jgi:signal transduction histidine kinase
MLGMGAGPARQALVPSGASTSLPDMRSPEIVPFGGSGKQSEESAPVRRVLNRPLVLDAVLALLLAVEAIASVSPQAPVAVIVFLLAGTLSLIARRFTPEGVLAATSIAFVVAAGAGYFHPPLPFAPLVAIYTVAVYRPPSISVPAGSASAVGSIAGSIVAEGGISDDTYLEYFPSFVAALTIGYGVRVGRARAALLEERSLQLAREEAKRTELAVELERGRIARELHDIVAHHVSVIVAQANAANLQFDSRPEQARQSLASIGTVGREALVEMRRLLGVLHGDNRHLDQAPMPGLDQLPVLIGQIERAGLPVELVISGNPQRLPAGIELSAYRIIQEALTNTLKHAGASRARVGLCYRQDLLELSISDIGRTGDTQGLADLPRSEGRGLIGMQQRVALLGGYLAAGPGLDGGFVVNAGLPTGERPQ